MLRRTQPAIIPKSACAARPDTLAPMPATLPLKTRLLKLPKDVTMTMTITGAAVAKVAFADVIVKGELLGD